MKNENLLLCVVKIAAERDIIYRTTGNTRYYIIISTGTGMESIRFRIQFAPQPSSSQCDERVRTMYGY